MLFRSHHQPQGDGEAQPEPVLGQAELSRCGMMMVVHASAGLVITSCNNVTRTGSASPFAGHHWQNFVAYARKIQRKGPLKMKNAPAKISPKPTAWFQVSFSPSTNTAKPTNTVRLITSWIVFSSAAV